HSSLPRVDARSLHDALPISRHEIWRTVFAVEDGEPVQRIAPPWRWSVPVVDLRGLPAGVREAEALHLARLDAVRPFDLAREVQGDRKSTRLNSSHVSISYAV